MLLSTIAVLVVGVAIHLTLRDGTPQPDLSPISPLVFVSPVTAAVQYPYFNFVVPESTYGLPGTVVLEAELRTDGNIITETYTAQAVLPVGGASADASGMTVMRWAVVDPGDEWLRATLHVTETERITHELYGRMFVSYGKYARSDDRRFYWHRSVEPYTLRMPVILN